MFCGKSCRPLLQKFDCNSSIASACGCGHHSHDGKSFRSCNRDRLDGRASERPQGIQLLVLGFGTTGRFRGRSSPRAIFCKQEMVVKSKSVLDSSGSPLLAILVPFADTPGIVLHQGSLSSNIRDGIVAKTQRKVKLR